MKRIYVTHCRDVNIFQLLHLIIICIAELNYCVSSAKNSLALTSVNVSAQLWVSIDQLDYNKMFNQISFLTLHIITQSVSYNKTLHHSINCIVPQLTHWGRVTHICVSDLTSIGADNGLSPGRRQAIIRTNAGTNFNEILIEILIFSFKKMRLKVSFAKRRPFCLGLN